MFRVCLNIIITFKIMNFFIFCFCWFLALSSLLSQCCNLVKLSIEHCTVDQACCSSIANNPNLKVLNISSTSGLEIVGLKYILSLKK